MFEQGRELLRRWFSDVEAQLIAEARRAGVFQHPTLTGGAREKIVRNTLREILPAQVEIGSGKVIGADCEPSKQVDIVIFDGRFPVLRMNSESLFPIEGVIATIEVKSELSESELRGALANAASVMQISPTFIKEDADAWIAGQQAQGATPIQASEELIWTLIPRTYVFAFDGLRSREAQSTAFQKSLSESMLGTASRPFIPSVIAGGGAVSIALGDQWYVRGSDPDQQKEIDQKGIALTFESDARFGILASHLLWHWERRTLMLEPPSSIRRSVRSYFPFKEYIDDCIWQRPFSVTLWHERGCKVQGGVEES